MEDRIFLWNTDVEGRVSLIKSRQDLHLKIKRANLLGGKVVIRTSELFEDGVSNNHRDRTGQGYIYEDAIDKETGLLYHLMKRGQAVLDLYDMDIEARAASRFKDDELFDRGEEVKSNALREKIYDRTMFRAKELISCDWDDAKSTMSEKIDQNELFVAHLKYFGEFFYDERFEDSKLYDFLQNYERVKFRSRLYTKLESELIEDYVGNKEELMDHFKMGLTFASIQSGAQKFGGKVGQIELPYLPYFLDTHRIAENRYQGTQSAIVESFLKVLPGRIIADDALGSFAKNALSLPADKFALEASKIDPKDREELHNLIYEESPKWKQSLNERVRDDISVLDRPKELNELVRTRIIQMEKEAQNRLERQASKMNGTVDVLIELAFNSLDPITKFFLGRLADKINTEILVPNRGIFEGYKRKVVK